MMTARSVRCARNGTHDGAHLSHGPGPAPVGITLRTEMRENTLIPNMRDLTYFSAPVSAVRSRPVITEQDLEYHFTDTDDYTWAETYYLPISIPEERLFAHVYEIGRAHV